MMLKLKMATTNMCDGKFKGENRLPAMFRWILWRLSKQYGPSIQHRHF